ncbi:NAD(P)/FAD-dependent oxidoreductase [Arcobacter sp. FWKO B]|uniref:NAD(P)/FAD-dependent oxidoreductase n=1 Tax=Arcobacter sp. FWKO B TaxID=2593672 RepID=UPI0018A62965|nr:FAD/NAD(P)-binding oxidoreductase [Arcobacter sp. FWKO B]QOG12302.1 NAD(P)/FAD-dependent oxidoreductase [Arcobacter sp. FWKO B]
MTSEKELNKIIEAIDAQMKKDGISRRDALKMAGVGSAALMMGTSSASAATQAMASNAKGKIVIVGGGLAGVATAAKLRNSLSNPDITVIEPNPESVSYQPGQTLVASGLWKKSDIMYNTKDFMPKGVNWIQDKVVEFDPDNNQVKTSSGKTIGYDFLIVATGCVLDFGAIKGLEEVGDVYSLDKTDAARAQKILGKDGLCSIYFADGAVDTWTQMQKFVADAKAGKKVKGVFPEPHTAFKCGGAQKKMVNLVDARLNEAKARANAELNFFTNGGALFGVPIYHEAISNQMKARNVNVNFSHKFIEVDPKNKVAVLEKHWQEKGEFDEDLGEYEMVRKTQRIEAEYDFCHVIPPQKAPNEVANSPIGSAQGWVPVTKETLQHVKYPNIFSLGDVAAVPLGKTGGSARKQYNVVVENLIATMEGKPMTAAYDGYTVCPLITSIGTVMMAEFKWNPDGPGAVPAPSFPLDPAQERWLMWLLKAYMLKPMTVYGMLSGRA